MKKKGLTDLFLISRFEYSTRTKINNDDVHGDAFVVVVAVVRGFSYAD